jgi:transcriptional regulator of NAD metabolism
MSGVKTPTDATQPSRAARQAELRALLRGADRPLPAGELAARFGVSRQVIVQDIAVLRAGGLSVIATARGYLSPLAARHQTVVAVRHGPDQVAVELTALVDAGVRVLDVAVEHPLYGELRGSLFLASRADVEEWLSRARGCRAHMLSELTDGQHFHTVEADRPEAIARARRALATLGILIDDSSGEESLPCN